MTFLLISVSTCRRQRLQINEMPFPDVPPSELILLARKNPAGLHQRGFFIALKEAAYLASLSSLAAAITSVEIFCGQGI
jgi:hypothetical protein